MGLQPPSPRVCSLRHTGLQPSMTPRQRCSLSSCAFTVTLPLHYLSPKVLSVEPCLYPYITVTLPLYYRYFTVTLPLHYRHITVTDELLFSSIVTLQTSYFSARPLHCRYFTVTVTIPLQPSSSTARSLHLPLHCRHMSSTLPLQPSSIDSATFIHGQKLKEAKARLPRPLPRPRPRPLATRHL